MPDPGRGVWVYAVGSDVVEDDVRRVVGVDGEMPRLVREVGLTAVVGSVALASFSEDELRRRLNDLGQLEKIARAHHDVVDAVSRHWPVLPSRLATMYQDDSGVRTTLREHHDAFKSNLRRVSGRQEWGVKAYHNQTGDAGPKVADRDHAESGTAYLRRRQAALSAEESSRKAAKAGAEMLHSRLSRLAVSTRLHRPQAPQLSGDDRRMVLNAAYLIDGERTEAFAETVTVFGRSNPELVVELTGPWPPYSFTDVDVEGDRP